MFTHVPLYVAVLSVSPHQQSGYFISPVCISILARLVKLENAHRLRHRGGNWTEIYMDLWKKNLIANFCSSLTACVLPLRY